MRTCRSLLGVMLALGAAAVSSCRKDATVPTTVGPSLTIISGDGVQDTIYAEPEQPLMVLVRGKTGRSEKGVAVQFEVPPEDRGSHYRIGLSADGTTFSYQSQAVTDSAGRARTHVRLGNLAGPARVVITVPQHELSDTARYTVDPGAATVLTVQPADTTVDIGAPYTLRAGLADQAGNIRPDPITFEASSSAVRVDAAGTVTAENVGRAWVRVGASLAGQAVTDSALVVGVPVADLAWAEGGHILLGDLSGVVTDSVPSASRPAWQPGESHLAYIENGSLHLRASDASDTVLQTPGVMPDWPQFSADGKWIYFQGRAASDGVTRIYRIAPDGTGMSMVNPTNCGEPSPSPDLTQVACISFGSLKVIDVATGTHHGVKFGSGAAAPRWSPDGAWIAFTDGQGRLVLVHPDGADAHRFGGHTLWAGISWSPDGHWILAAQSKATLVDLPDSDMIDLTWSPGRNMMPSWGR